jgi:hypothetical protein
MFEMFNKTIKATVNANAIANTTANKRAGAFDGGTSWG